MTNEEQIAGIQADVDHCRAVFCEKNEPCYHCGQKQFLLDMIKSLKQYSADQAKDADNLNALATTAMKAAGMIPGEKVDLDQYPIVEIIPEQIVTSPIVEITAEQIAASQEQPDSFVKAEDVSVPPFYNEVKRSND